MPGGTLWAESATGMPLNGPEIRSALAVDAKRMPGCGCGPASVPRASGGMGGGSPRRTWNGCMIGTKGSHDGDAGGRRPRPSPASRDPDPPGRAWAIRWTLSMTGSYPVGGSRV